MKIKKPFNIFSLVYPLGFKKFKKLDIDGKSTFKKNLQNKLPKAILSQYDFIIQSGVKFWWFHHGLALINIYKRAKGRGLLLYICLMNCHYRIGYY